MISLIAAVDGNFLIGDGEKLPWHYPQDLAFFKKKVNDQVILVGLRTYQSLCYYYKNKKFPFKSIYLATTSLDIPAKYYRDDISIQKVNDVKIFLQDIRKTSKSIIVIGGRQIYQLALPYVDVLYLTYILRRFVGNIYFPYLNLCKYILKEYTVIEELIFATYYKKN
ncbi:MAG: dihydrofolate reductase [Candidatus Phytoplasma australasiaticum]|nr:dihydrofolate reductase [Candidatus Phytoplasma australasiaticum]